MTLETKDYNVLCEGFLNYNPVMGSLLLNHFNDFEHYTKPDSIGLTSYLFENFQITDYGYLSDDEQWGYVGNVLFTVIGKYVNPHEYDETWLHIRIEAMK